MASAITLKSTKYKIAAITMMLIKRPGIKRLISFIYCYPCRGTTRELNNKILTRLAVPLRTLFFIQFQHGHEGFLWNFHVTHHLEALLALLLFLKQFLLAGDITAITFGEHILACGLDVGARDDPSAGSGLNSHIIQLAWNQI